MSQENQTVQCDPVADVLASTTLLACPSHQQKIKFKNKRIIANLPVVIAEPKIQINVESTIRLEDFALEIKDIKKSICLTQCELLPTDDKKSGKLFLSGFVRKNIQYATAATVRNGVVSGDIRHTTASIPFDCFAKVDYLEEPDFEANESAVKLEVLGDSGMCSDPYEADNIQAERLNRRVYCELVEAKFREKDIIQNLRPVSSQNPNVRVFDTFVEKMIIDVVIKILQVQQVEIGGGRDGRDGKDGCDGKDGNDGKGGRDGKDSCDGRDGRDGKGKDDDRCDKDRRDDRCDWGCDKDRRDDRCDWRCDKDRRDDRCDCRCDKGRRDDRCDCRCDKGRRDDRCDWRCDRDRRDDRCDWRCDNDRKHEFSRSCCCNNKAGSWRA